MLRDVDPALIADLFYTRLFLEHPGLRKLFPADMSSQHQKLISMLQVVVARLDHFDSLTTDLANLAQRHVQYGVVPEQYKYVGAALLWTLERSLGAGWTPEVADAWKTCYQMLSQAMINAVESASA